MDIKVLQIGGDKGAQSVQKKKRKSQEQCPY